MDYFKYVSTKDYVAASFTFTLHEKKMVKWIKRPVGRSRNRLLERSKADKENVQVAPDPRNSEQASPIVLFCYSFE